jgi:hypothetical protein
MTCLLVCETCLPTLTTCLSIRLVKKPVQVALKKHRTRGQQRQTGAFYSSWSFWLLLHQKSQHQNRTTDIHTVHTYGARHSSKERKGKLNFCLSKIPLSASCFLLWFSRSLQRCLSRSDPASSFNFPFLADDDISFYSVMSIIGFLLLPVLESEASAIQTDFCLVYSFT